MQWVRIYLGVIFHPIEAFRRMKYYRESFNYKPVAIVLVAVMVVRMVYIYISHFPMVGLNPENANIFFEMIKFIVPLVSWGLITFAISAIWDGETFLKECMAASTMAIIPYVVLAIPIGLISNVLEKSSAGFLSFFNTATFIWVALLLFLGLMTMNDFTFKHTVQVYLTSIISMVLFWAVFLLLATLTYQFINFIGGVILEIQLRFGL
jgi:hypothetical protein